MHDLFETQVVVLTKVKSLSICWYQVDYFFYYNHRQKTLSNAFLHKYHIHFLTSFTFEKMCPGSYIYAGDVFCNGQSLRLVKLSIKAYSCKEVVMHLLEE